MLTVGKKRRKTGSQQPLGITSAAPFSSFRQLAPFQRSAPLPWLRLASMHRRPPQFNMTILPPRFSSIATFAGSCKMVILNWGGRLCIEASRNQGKGAERWKGANWRNEENGAALVIPRGY